ncbi:DNA topoisomerase IB [Roseivirga seohaensis]|uniref:DNA topoisomerase IB n=1 Tax=Roseivirga seohaensis TaxID=1914963 RepID=UPI003BAB9DE9
MSPLENCPHNIQYIPDECNGFKRIPKGDKFIYKTKNGKVVKKKSLLKRFESLVIPPMWTEVWICEHEFGHLQATGYDQKLRKQYIYHPFWIDFRQKQKYAKLFKFGQILPVIRRQAMQDIQLKGWPKKKILAVLVSLLDQHYIRIGNQVYRKENETYGLTTLRRKHLEDEGSKLKLSYKAKSGKYRNITIKNQKLANLIRKSSELPGYEVFRYIDEHGKSQKLDSSDVNEYLYNITESHFTAKDFRTWGGTVVAIDSYPAALKAVEENTRLNLETTIVKKVAKVLGNTIATCREYYIHPKVLNILTQGELTQYEQKKPPKVKYQKELRKNELLALSMIQNK